MIIWYSGILVGIVTMLFFYFLIKSIIKIRKLWKEWQSLYIWVDNSRTEIDKLKTQLERFLSQSGAKNYDQCYQICNNLLHRVISTEDKLNEKENK